MRTVLFTVLVLAACEGKRAEPRVTPAKAAAASRSPRQAMPPSLPPDRPAPYKLGRKSFVWSFAEASNTALAWDTAAEAYEQELADCHTRCSETAYAILLARKNALLV